MTNTINGTRQLGDWEHQKFREDSSGKPAIAVVNADGSMIGSSPLTERYDYDNATTIYTATAAIGTANSAIGWTIVKYDLSDSNSASGKVATDVSWDNRTTGSFN